MDITCRKCGEPWDQYGLFHGDTNKWETDLILKGAGCPCCKGEVDKEHELSFNELDETDCSLEGEGTLDYIEGSNEPWVKPPPKILFHCSNCNQDRVVDQNNIYYDGRGNELIPDWILDNENNQQHEVEDKIVCNHCYEHDFTTCDACNELVHNDDSYFFQSLDHNGAVVCNNCFENGETFNCESCNEESWSKDIHTIEDEDGCYCEYCYDQKMKEKEDEA